MSGDDTNMDGIIFVEDHDFAGNKFKCLPEDRDKHHLILVFAYWCPNCHGMRSLFRQLHQQIPGVRFYLVNGTGKRGEPHLQSKDSEAALMKRWKDIVQPKQFRGFPSMYLFDPQGNMKAEFEAQRTVEGIQKFLQTHIKG